MAIWIHSVSLRTLALPLLPELNLVSRSLAKRMSGAIKHVIDNCPKITYLLLMKFALSYIRLIEEGLLLRYYALR